MQQMAYLFIWYKQTCTYFQTQHFQSCARDSISHCVGRSVSRSVRRSVPPSHFTFFRRSGLQRRVRAIGLVFPKILCFTTLSPRYKAEPKCPSSSRRVEYKSKSDRVQTSNAFQRSARLLFFNCIQNGAVSCLRTSFAQFQCKHSISQKFNS